MKCKICTSPTTHVFDKVVLQKYSANFDLCEKCGFLSIRNPHWLAEAYTDAIASADTGAVARNLMIARNLTAICDRLGAGPFLDIGGGTGLLVRLMRDRGFDFYWSDEYCANIYAQGFENPPKKCLAVTAFEVLEHTINPIEFIEKALTSSNTIIFSQELFNGDPPDDWWYYSLSTGQHISFFQRKTLIEISRLFGLKYMKSLGLHILSKDNSIKIASPINLALSFMRRRKSLIQSDYSKLTGNIIG